MAKSHINNFERWRRHLPENTAYLVSRAIDEIVPVFRDRGFEWHADYAGGGTRLVGPNCIALQRRSGTTWPTVEIRFGDHGRPFLSVDFGELPEVCRIFDVNGPELIPRLESNAGGGRASFILGKGHRRNMDGNFGYAWFAFRPKHKLDNEVAALKARSQWLVDVLDQRIPEAWYADKPGYVDQYVFLSPASNMFMKWPRPVSGQSPTPPTP